LIAPTGACAVAAPAAPAIRKADRLAEDERVAHRLAFIFSDCSGIAVQ